MWPLRRRLVALVGFAFAGVVVAAVASSRGTELERPAREARLVLPCAQPYVVAAPSPILLESLRASVHYGALPDPYPDPAAIAQARVARPRVTFGELTPSRRERILEALRSFTDRIRPEEVVTVQPRRVVLDAEECEH